MANDNKGFFKKKPRQPLSAMALRQALYQKALKKNKTDFKL